MKYKCDDKVWVYVDPSNLVDVTEIPIFECTVESITITTKYDFSTEVSYQDVNYQLGLGWDNLYRKECEIFSTKEEAVTSSLQLYADKISLLEKRLNIYKSVYSKMLEI